MSQVLPYADIVFCNEDEAAALGKKMSWGSNLADIAKKLVEFPKENSKRTRTVIFTQGAKETIVVGGNGSVEKYAPIPVSANEIVDTNGAGDSFVGGFLSQYVQGKPIERCVSVGHYVAMEVIKRSGCTFPSKPQYNQ